jgi:RNA polymerase sigma-70 factor (ECF subfamily)
MAAVGQQTLVGPVDTARLYELHYRRVFSYCLWRLGKREDAEDAAQTTFLNAHRALGRGTTPESESSWLLTIAQNVCLARWRSQKSRPTEHAAEPEAIAALAAPDHDPQLVGRLQAALAELPEVQRRAFVLREWQGLSYAEIATELDTTETAVAALVFRARRSLMGTLSDERAPSRAGVGLNVGSLLGWLKSLLGGTAAKVAVAGTVVGAAAIGAGVPLVQHDKPASKAKGIGLTPIAAVAKPAAPKQTAHRVAPASVAKNHSHPTATAGVPQPERVRTPPTPGEASSPQASPAPPAPSGPSTGPPSTPPAPPSPGDSAPISIPAPSPPNVTDAAAGVLGAVQELVPQVPTLAPPSLPPPLLPTVPQLGP